MEREVMSLRPITVRAYGLTPITVVALNALSPEITVLEGDCSELMRHADAPAYILTAEVMVHHSDFFMPRRRRCLLYSPMARTYLSYADTLYVDDDPSVALRMLKEVLHGCDVEQTKQSTPALSTRETDVLRAIAKGFTAKEIANELCISVNTVLTHRKNISAKLGIRSVSGLSLYALMNGILD